MILAPSCSLGDITPIPLTLVPTACRIRSEESAYLIAQQRRQLGPHVIHHFSGAASKAPRLSRPPVKALQVICQDDALCARSDGHGNLEWVPFSLA